MMLLSFFSRYGAGQLKVMFVGGPNVRKDYHIDEGEEVTKFNCGEKHAQFWYHLKRLPICSFFFH